MRSSFAMAPGVRVARRDARKVRGTQNANGAPIGPSEKLRVGRMDATSDSLLEGARANDADSWSRLVRLYTPLVLCWCRQRGLCGQHEHAAQDVCQEVFGVVFKKITSFRKDG